MTENIGAGDALPRRIPNVPALLTEDGGTVRPSSAAMTPSSEDGALSVDVRRLLPDPRHPQDTLGELPDHGLVEFVARVPIELNLQVEHAPLPTNPAHADISGFDALSRARAKRARREMAKAARWICMPAGARDAG